jgi:hypothetical protein
MTQAQFGHGVVGRFLVRLQTDDFPESFGNSGAVLRDMPDLAVRQPELEQQVQGQKAGKGQGESGASVHIASLGLFVFPSGLAA